MFSLKGPKLSKCGTYLLAKLSCEFYTWIV